MEVDGGGGGSGSGGEGGGGGGGGSVEMGKKNSPEGETKVKRKMKTPSQLEVLEKTYAGEFILLTSFVSFFFFSFNLALIHYSYSSKSIANLKHPCNFCV